MTLVIICESFLTMRGKKQKLVELMKELSRYNTTKGFIRKDEFSAFVIFLLHLYVMGFQLWQKKINNSIEYCIM